MKRADTTSADHQQNYRGRHRVPGTGVWSYPTTVNGKTAAGTRYLRCPCGWRLIEITRRQMDAAHAQWRAHVDEITLTAASRPATDHTDSTVPPSS